jgi:LysM repeat protein
MKTYPTMINKIIHASAVLILLLMPFMSFAKVEATVEEYIQQYREIAIREMKQYGIPASITLAQGILESGMGTSILATKGNNHFGIKCHETWTGATMKHTDDAPNECFRVYKHAEESYIDHSIFLTTRPRYAFLFELNKCDYRAWAHGLKKAGYATNPKYPQMLIDCIERNQLYVYDDENSSLAQMENRRYTIKEKEKEELIALDGKAAPVAKTNTGIKVSVPAPTSQGTVKANTSATGIVFFNNKVKTVRAKKGQTPKMIADEFNISVKKFCEYNDITAMSEIKEGQLLYLQPKKKKSKSKTHLVLKHENLWLISQLYAINLDKLYERNLLSYGEEPAEGALIYLNKTAPRKPKLRPEGKNFVPQDPQAVEVHINPVKDSEKTVVYKNSLPTPKPPVENTPAKPQPQSNPTIGDVLKQSSEPSTTNFPNNDNKSFGDQYVRHLVIKGDTLYNISKRYGVSIEQIKFWNNLIDGSIKLGQELKIYK